MRLLIAQGPGYYGVNIRILSDEEGAAVEKVLDVEHTVPPDYPIMNFASSSCGTSLILTGKIDIHQSNGFDTGWWSEGEAALNALMDEVRKQQ